MNTKIKILAVAAIFAVVAGKGANALVFAGPASLAIDADPSQPSAITAPLGSTGNTLSIFRFTETTGSEDVAVSSFTVLASTTSNVDPFNTVTLSEGSTTLGTSGTATPVAGGFDYSFNLSTPVIVPAGGSVSLTLTGDASAADSDAENAAFTFLIDPEQPMSAIGQTSETQVAISCDASNLETVTIGGEQIFAASSSGNTPTAEIGVNVGVDNPIPLEGSTINYTVTVSAIGPSISMGVVANDLLPAGVTFVSATTSAGTYNNTTGAWTIGMLAGSSNATLTITATVDASTTGQLINDTATVHESASLNDPLTGNNSSTQAIDVGGQVLGASTTASSSDPDSLLAGLFAQLRALEKQLVTQQFAAVPCTLTFTKDLSLGTTDTEVKNLQTALNYSIVTQVAATGAGSPGNESTFFGTSTQNAVITFQNVFALNPTGSVDSSTRAQLNGLCGQ